MKAWMLRGLKKLGHWQAMILLTLVFFLVLTPYGLLVRCWKKDLLPRGDWQKVEGAETNLDSLRRTF